jgi:3-phosphoshikimate 1-carboxyvinyltransferase
LSPNLRQIRLPGLRQQSRQGDAVLTTLFSELGISSQFKSDELIITKTQTPVETFIWDFSDCPDLAQTLAVTCAGLGVKATFKGLESLRIKETDRIAALNQELNRLGSGLEQSDESSWTVKMPIRFPQEQVMIRTYHDHRMAMAFAPLACLNDILIEEPGVVAKSFPTFWKELVKTGIQFNESS